MVARINLLPWREERRQERQRQFHMALLAGFIFSALALYLAVAYVNDQIAEQESRNAFLSQEITLLDKKIEDIKDLEAKREKLNARIQVIQDLQQSRPKAVKVFDAIVRTIPEGLYLESLKREGGNLSFDGVAESNARVSVFMNELDQNDEFGESTLKVVQRTSNREDKKDIRKFTIQVKESKP